MALLIEKQVTLEQCPEDVQGVLEVYTVVKITRIKTNLHTQWDCLLGEYAYVDKYDIPSMGDLFYSIHLAEAPTRGLILSLRKVD